LDSDRRQSLRKTFSLTHRSVNQVIGTDKRGTSTALGGSMGQIGGIISAVAFPKKDSPEYFPGCAINVSFLCVGIAAAEWLWGWTTWGNRQRDLGRRDHLGELSEEEQKNIGERHPDFRFYALIYVNEVEDTFGTQLPKSLQDAVVYCPSWSTSPQRCIGRTRLTRCHRRSICNTLDGAVRQFITAQASHDAPS
jgi:hypothetical protein